MHFHRLFTASAFALFLCSVGVLPASAQTDAPRDAATSRAARDAENPMRMIIEASKLKVRIKPDGPEAVPTEKRVPPPPPPKPAAAAAPVAKKAASAPTVASAASQALPVAVAELEAAPVAPPPQAVAKAAEVVTPVAMLSPPPAQTLAPQPLKLAQMVEPSLPGSVLRRMRNDVEVVVGFTVNADGSVSEVVIRSNPMKSLDAPVVEAVSQWRYEPIREARTHAVQLVLRASP